MSKYTKTPWLRSDLTVYALEYVGRRKGIEQFRNRFSLLVQGSPDTPKEELEAVARLIEAAPELLEALKLALEHLDTLYPTARGDDFLVDTCVAAIAKATGEAP